MKNTTDINTETYHYGGRPGHTHDWRLKLILWVIVIMVACALISVILGFLKYAVDACMIVATVCAVIALGFICCYYIIKSKTQQNRILHLKQEQKKLENKE